MKRGKARQWASRRPAETAACEAAACEVTAAFQAAVTERLKAIERDLERLQSRVNWLMTVIVGAAIGNVVLALVTGA